MSTTVAQREPTTTDPDPTERRLGPLLGVLICANFVMVLNETVFGLALRAVSADLAVPPTTAQWLTSGFLLTMAVVIPTAGYLLDRFTPRRVFVTALALFGVGTLLGGLAPGFAPLLLARAVQAAGTALMIPLTMTTIMRLVRADRRGAVMGTFTVVVAVAPAVGPTLGGAVLAWLGWRGLFWSVLPLALVALAAGARWLRLPGGGRTVPLDVPSVLLSAAGFGGLVLGLSWLGEGGEHLLPPLLAVAGGVAALVVFVDRQRRLQMLGRPLLDLRVFTQRGFATAVVLIVLVQLTVIGVAAVLLPVFVQVVLGAGIVTTGLALLPGGLLSGLLGRPVGLLLDRLGVRPLVVPGAVLIAAALVLLATLGPGSLLVVVIAIHVLLMAGLALVMTPLVIETLGRQPEELQAHGSAVLATLQQLAGAVGSALFVSAAAAGSDDAATLDADGLDIAFTVGGGVGLVAVLVSLLIRRHEPGGATA